MADTNQVPIEDFYNSRFQVGQVWEYQTRLVDPKSTLQILNVQRLYGTTVAVHVQVNGLNLKSVPKLKDGGTASHLPFSEESIEASVTNLLRANQPLPEDYKEGYETWYNAFMEGKAGVFTMPVARVVNMIEETMSGTGQSK